MFSLGTPVHGQTGGTSEEEDTAMGDLTTACLHMEIVPGSLLRWAAGGGEDNRQAEIGEVPNGERENSSTVLINEPAAQAAPRGCTVAVLGGFQDPSRQSPVLDLMAEPILSSRLG